MWLGLLANVDVEIKGGCYDFFDFLLKVLHFQSFFVGVGEDI